MLPNALLRDMTSDDGHRFISWRYKPGQRVQLTVPVEQWKERIVLPVDAVAHAEAFSRSAVTCGDRVGRAVSAAMAIGSPATLLTMIAATAPAALALATLVPKVHVPREMRAIDPAGTAAATAPAGLSRPAGPSWPAPPAPPRSPPRVRAPGTTAACAPRPASRRPGV